MNSYLPGVADTTATLKTSYEPSDDETAFLHRLTDHQLKIEDIRKESASDRRRYTHKEPKENILPRLKNRGTNFEATVMSIVGDHVCDTNPDESIDQFIKTEELVGLEREKD